MVLIWISFYHWETEHFHSYICVCMCVCIHTYMHAKSLQLCLALFNPMDCSPPKLLCPWDSPGKNTDVGCHAFLQGIFPTQGLNLRLLTSPALVVRFFSTSAAWEATHTHTHTHNILFCQLVLSCEMSPWVP